jgi:hypothetical protein
LHDPAPAIRSPLRRFRPQRLHRFSRSARSVDCSSTATFAPAPLKERSNKTGVVYSEIMSVGGAPERLSNRTTVWNEVEAGEKRKDAQLAREFQFSISREMNQQQGVQLTRDFVDWQFVRRGMVADLNVH